MLSPTFWLHTQGKRVCIVGNGQAAADIAEHLYYDSAAASIAMSTRTGFWVFPKTVKGKPAEYIALRRRAGKRTDAGFNRLLRRVMLSNKVRPVREARIEGSRRPLADHLGELIHDGHVAVEGAIDHVVPTGIVHEGSSVDTPVCTCPTLPCLLCMCCF